MKAWILVFIFAALAYATVQGAWYFAVRVASAQQAPAAAHPGSVGPTLQMLRGNIELYKIQHHEHPPDAWNQLLKPTNLAGATSETPGPDFPLGPYLSGIPANPVNGKSDVANTPSPAVGWVYVVNGTQYTVEAVNTSGDGVLSY